MNILFEEEGAFKAGAIIADNTTSLQVELPGGKRSKVKASHVLLRFDAPTASELMTQAQQEAQNLDTEFLWQALSDGEFDFIDCAREYVGHTPAPVEAATILFALHAAPMYFHRKGRGRFRRAPPEILQAAIAGMEKKRQQALACERMCQEILAQQLPQEFTALLPELLYKPDRNKLECKALEAASQSSGSSALQLLAACGALPSSHDYHLGRFLFEHKYLAEAKVAAEYTLTAALSLPLATVRAFSIDDAQTTEIDDAFSLTPGADGSMWVGIHIAAPSLGFSPEHPLGAHARQRLSTVYMPGRKITMLPDAVIRQFTLAADCSVPALSLYLEIDSAFNIRSHRSVIEVVSIAANLRHHDLEPLFNTETLAAGLTEFAYAKELTYLWRLTQQLATARQANLAQHRKEYNFTVDWQSDTAYGHGRIDISERTRGSPLDTLVAELMIVANARWGSLLRDAGIAALYRNQAEGRVRMSTVAARHEGLGVDCYAWMTSPLRRYCDLLNQWQLVALLRNEPPPFGLTTKTNPKSPQLFAALQDFELTYAAYAEFQRHMENYWCLRYLLQEERKYLRGTIVRDNVLRLDDLPLVLTLSGAPSLERGEAALAQIEHIDLLQATISARYVTMTE